MAHRCNRCGKRQQNRVCPECVAATQCKTCGVQHGKGAQVKYCDVCLAANGYPRPEGYKESKRVKSPKMEWRGEEYLGLRPSTTDWARLAAYIDGEGSINLSPRLTGQSKSLTLCGKVVVTNTDFRLIKWCSETFGMSFHTRSFEWAGGRADKWKPCYWANANGYRAAWILNQCLPWFLMKREQALVVLEHQQTTAVGYWGRGKGVQTPTDILAYRQSLKDKLTQLNRRGPNNEIAKDA